eukprot:1192765-Lingulodinium_polyedra.AAC.1
MAAHACRRQQVEWRAEIERRTHPRGRTVHAPASECTTCPSVAAGSNPRASPITARNSGRAAP